MRPMDIALESLEVRHPAAVAGSASALQGLHLQVKAGEHVAVIGPSGAGKTTLLQALAVAIRPADGRIALAGEDPWTLKSASLRQLRSRVFYAPQIPPLPPRQRVVTALSSAKLPQLSLAQSALNLLIPRFAQPSHEALSAFDLGEKLWLRVDRLSGGERQRVGLAKAFMSSAELWLIDEPLSALDPKRSRQAIEALVSEANRRGVTLIATLHQVGVAREMFPRIIGLRDGMLEFDLPRERLSDEALMKLYAQFEHELEGRAPAEQVHELVDTVTPTVIACR
jgi:phosphonate transport system ATP-binding protein